MGKRDLPDIPYGGSGHERISYTGQKEKVYCLII